MMKVVSPYKVKKVIFERNYPGYLYRREIVDISDYSDYDDLEMVNCYSTDTGHWIGDAKMARYLCKKNGLRLLQKTRSSHCVCSIGFNETEQKWYGWSHRAMCGFGVGDKLFEEKFGNETTLFVEHGKQTIVTLDESKQAASKFAMCVS